MSTQISGTPNGLVDNSINFTVENTGTGQTVFSDSDSKVIGKFSNSQPTGTANYKANLSINQTIILPAGNYRFGDVNTVTHSGTVTRNTQYYLSVQIEDAPVQGIIQLCMRMKLLHTVTIL